MTNRKVYEVWYTGGLKSVSYNLFIHYAAPNGGLFVHRILCKCVSFCAWTLAFDIP